jgi:hypothetical protein
MERTIAEAARDLGISKAAIYLAIENNRIKTVERAGATIKKITAKEFERFKNVINSNGRRGPKAELRKNGKRG